MSRLVLFHSPMSRSVRPYWLLEEMGQPFELKTLPFDPDYYASEEYQRINPVGQVPVLYDGEERILESTVIMEYLLNRYDSKQLAVSVNHEEYSRFIQWLHLSESGLCHYLSILVGNRLGTETTSVSDQFDAYAEKKVNVYLSLAREQLGDKPFLLKHGFSAADISLGYALFITKDFLKMPLPEEIDQYLQRLRERPAWEKVIK